MPRNDDENLEALKAYRDQLIDALATPSDIGPFGGLPDSNGPASVQRMPARSQLHSELRWVESRIEELEANAPYIRESRGVT